MRGILFVFLFQPIHYDRFLCSVLILPYVNHKSGIMFHNVSAGSVFVFDTKEGEGVILDYGLWILIAMLIKAKNGRRIDIRGQINYQPNNWQRRFPKYLMVDSNKHCVFLLWNNWLLCSSYAVSACPLLLIISNCLAYVCIPFIKSMSISYCCIDKFEVPLLFRSRASESRDSRKSVSI